MLEALAPAWDVTLIAPAGPVPPGVAEAIAVSLPQASTVPWRYDASPLGEALDRMLGRRRFDRALMFAGAEALGFSRRGFPPAAADLIDCNALEVWRAMRTAPGWRARLYWLRELLTSIGYARRGFRAFAATICVGETDAAWLRRMGVTRVHVVPNGVTLPESAPPESDEPVLSFTGTLDYHPNVDPALFAARVVFPHVRAALPEARLLIAGRRPVPEVEELAALPGVEVVADVADMRAVLARTRVGLAPMRAGSGIKNKVPGGMGLRAAGGDDPGRGERAVLAGGSRQLGAGWAGGTGRGGGRPAARAGAGGGTWRCCPRACRNGVLLGAAGGAPGPHPARCWAAGVTTRRSAPSIPRLAAVPHRALRLCPA